MPSNQDLLEYWVNLVHYADCGLRGEWDDDPRLPEGWWDTPESQYDPDDEEEE